MIMHKLREDGNLFYSEFGALTLLLVAIMVQRWIVGWVRRKCFILTTWRCKGWRLHDSAWPSAGAKDCGDPGLHHWKASWEEFQKWGRNEYSLNNDLKSKFGTWSKRMPELEVNRNMLSRAEYSKRAQTRAYIAEKAVKEDRVRRFNTQRSSVPGEKVECQGICMWTLFNNRLDVGSWTDGWGDKQNDPGQTYREMKGQSLHKIMWCRTWI